MIPIFVADEILCAQLTTERIKGVDVKTQNLNKLKSTSTEHIRVEELGF